MKLRRPWHRRWRGALLAWPSWRRSGVRTNLRAIILLVCLLLCGTELFEMRASREASLSVASRESVNLARSLAENAHGIFQAADTVLLGLVERVRTDGFSPQATDRLDRLVAMRRLALPFLHAVVIVQEGGTPVGSTDAQLALRHHRDDPRQDAFIGPPVRSAQDGAWILSISRRLEHADGSFAGVAIAEIETAVFRRLYDSVDIGRAGIIVLAADDGTLLVRRPFAEANVGRDLSRGELLSRFASAGPGSTEWNGRAFTYRSLLDGRIRLGSAYRVDGTHLVIVAALEHGEVLAAWRAQARIHGAALLLILAALLLLGWRLSRQIAGREHDQELLRDSHERLVAAEAVTAEAMSRLELAERIARVGHWRLGLPQEVLTWSDEVYRIYGVRRTTFELTLKSALDGYHEQDRAVMAGAVENAWRERCGFEICARIVRPSGEIRHVMSRGMAQIGPDGEVAALFGVFMDVTEQKETEGALLLAHEAAAAANRALEAIAMQDGLTGLANRRQFDQALQQEFRRAVRIGSSLALVLIDVDRFKQFNDLYGHPSGDACLRAIAGAIQPLATRPGDLVARYGGEEIAVLLPGNDTNGARVVAEAVAGAVRALRIAHGGATSGIVTVSAGFEAFEPAHNHEVPGELVQRADIALYAAKRDGRDTVRWYGEIQPFATGALMEPGA